MLARLWQWQHAPEAYRGRFKAVRKTLRGAWLLLCDSPLAETIRDTLLYDLGHKAGYVIEENRDGLGVLLAVFERAR